MIEIKVDRPGDCPFRCGYSCALGDRCVFRDCPLKTSSIMVNIGSLGLADVSGQVGKSPK